MDSKEIKSALKEAREAIKKKEFAVSMKICKNILRSDKTNYMALVFFGISLQEVGPKDQAPNAFRKAIAISADQSLAWTGLANYYEHADTKDASKELILIYEKLLGLETENAKFSDLCSKLVMRAVNIEEIAKGVEILKTVATCDKTSDNNRRTAWLALASLFMQANGNLTTELLNTFELTLCSIVKERQCVTSDYYKEYLKLLYKLNKYELLFDEAIAMSALYESSIYPLEWICKVYVELIIENNPIVERFEGRIDTYYLRLLELQQDGVMGIFTRGVKSFKNGLLIAAREDLKKVVSIRPGLTHAWVILADCYAKLYCYNESIEAASRADKMLKSLSKENAKLRQKIDVILLCSLSQSNDSENWAQVIKLGENKILDDNILSYLITAYINLNQYETATKYLEKLEKTSPYYISLHAKLLRKQNKLKEALMVLNERTTDESSEIYVEIGSIQWDLHEFDLSLISFLKAAKLDPNYYISFVYLGRYYEQRKDYEKARRCYQKAFQINPRCSEAGMALSNIYRQQKNWAANFELLLSVTGTNRTGLQVISSDVRWAWLQLGLHYMEQGEYSSAIDSLRSVIRVEPKNGHYWECLADAYMARGAYTSAIRSYERTVELMDEVLYPKLQIASINLLLDNFEEAKLQFKDLLQENERYVPALKGFAENCLKLAFSQRNQQFFGLCRDNAQFALDKLTIALKERADLSCLWKLSGDCCSLVASLPDKYNSLQINSLLAQPSQDEKIIDVKKLDLYTVASRCYCKAISLTQTNILLWYDLAQCYYSYGCVTDDLEQRHLFLNRALTTAKYCVKHNPNNWQYWNLFGVIAARIEILQYSLAQHAFIKAVTLDNNSAIAWSNLGTLYLRLNNSILANKAYSQAQRSDPSYANSWVGQALIAESFGRGEAMDLFRHSTQLGHHSQSALGYAHWVCRTVLEATPHQVIYSIHNMHAIPVACDSLTWFTEQNKDNACAWNMLGLLRERLGLKESAIDAFKESLFRADDTVRDKVIINYARLLVQTGKWNDAIVLYKQVREASFNSGCGKALALFKAKQYEESYEEYNATMQWLTDSENLQSHVLVALAAMVYMFQEPDAAKRVLFQSMQLKPPSAWGLYATLALGLLHGDYTLAQLVLKELQAIKDNAEILYHYSVLQALLFLIQGDKLGAVRSITKSVHRHPGQASLWLFLSTLLLQLDPKMKSVAASKCAQKAMHIGRSQMDVSKVLCIATLAAITSKDYKKALNLAQRAVHSYPAVAENWAVLISALSHLNDANSWTQKRDWLQMAKKHVHTTLNPSNRLSTWLIQ